RQRQLPRLHGDGGPLGGQVVIGGGGGGLLGGDGLPPSDSLHDAVGGVGDEVAALLGGLRCRALQQVVPQVGVELGRGQDRSGDEGHGCCPRHRGLLERDHDDAAGQELAGAAGHPVFAGERVRSGGERQARRGVQ